MDDLISRQAALSVLASIAGVGNRALDKIRALPSAQPEQRWIPVSERLPDEYEYVLLCDIEPDEDTGYSRMAVGWLEDGKICCWDDRATRDEFVAWMPLPEPYKEDNNG